MMFFKIAVSPIDKQSSLAWDLIRSKSIGDIIMGGPVDLARQLSVEPVEIRIQRQRILEVDQRVFNIPPDIDISRIETINDIALLLQDNNLSQGSKNWVNSMLFLNNERDKLALLQRIEELKTQANGLENDLNGASQKLEKVRTAFRDTLIQKAYEEHVRIETEKFNQFMTASDASKLRGGFGKIGAGIVAAPFGLPIGGALIVWGILNLTTPEEYSKADRYAILGYIQRGLTFEEALREWTEEMEDAVNQSRCYDVDGETGERKLRIDYESGRSEIDDYIPRSDEFKNPKLFKSRKEIFAPKQMPIE